MFPNARDRRLGSRGSSKYCYVGIKRKSDAVSKSASSNPYSAEDLSKAYQTVVCEWASTVLSRRMPSLEELAKYLLKHRFVQTRSCAALTITASLKDTDELTEATPVNKHRETQLKLQEKLREKLNNKRATSFRSPSVDDAEMYGAQRADGAFNKTQSACSTPDPEGQLRQQIAMQTSSAPGSSRTSPEHTAMSVTNSACTSPASELVQKPLYPINYHRNGYDTATGSINETRMVLSNAMTPINSQCSSTVGSERNTPVTGLYNTNTQITPQMNPQTPHYQQYDPRIQSCPNTPLPSYRQQQRFDFPAQPQLATNSPQCVSLPNSTRNTPVVPDYQDSCGSYYPSLQRPFNNSGNIYQPDLAHQQPSFSQSYPNFQRLTFARNNNSAFMPIKDGSNSMQINTGDQLQNSYSDGTVYNDCPTKAVDFNEPQSHGDNVELEINELFSIIENNETSTAEDDLASQHTSKCASGEASAVNLEDLDRARPLSAHGPITLNTTHHSSQLQPHQTSSVIYDLLKSGTNHVSDSSSSQMNQRFRHHSGPPLGHATTAYKAKYSQAAAVKPMSTSSCTHNSTSLSAEHLNSPPSTPNGNFRPVQTPSGELRMYYGAGDSQQSHFHSRTSNPSPACPVQSTRYSNPMVGTMSPPAQPLIKRKRNHSGENVSSPLVGVHISAKGKTSTAPSTITSQEKLDYVARRNLGNRLASPQSIEDGTQINKFANGQKATSSFHEEVSQISDNHPSGVRQ